MTRGPGLWKLAKKVQDEAYEVLLCSTLGYDEAHKWFAEMRERTTAGRTTVDDENDLPIAKYVAELSGELEIFVAALAWLIDAQDSYERTNRPNPTIPAELAEAARRYAAQVEREGVES